MADFNFFTQDRPCVRRLGCYIYGYLDALHVSLTSWPLLISFPVSPVSVIPSVRFLPARVDSSVPFSQCHISDYLGCLTDLITCHARVDKRASTDWGLTKLTFGNRFDFVLTEWMAVRSLPPLSLDRVGVRKVGSPDLGRLVDLTVRVLLTICAWMTKVETTSKKLTLTEQ